MNDATKRKEPEAETAVKEPEAEPAVKADESKSLEKKSEAAEAPQIAVAVKPAATSSEPEAKRLKPTPPDAGTVRKQVEYYLSDDNLRRDKFFHDKISGNKEGWLEIALILSCNKMKAMRATTEDVLAAVNGSKIEISEDKLSMRRPGNLSLPALEAKQHHQKKNTAHAHDGGVIALIKGIPAEQSWMQIKDGLRAKLPDKVQLWFVGEVNDKSECVMCSAPFEGDVKFFDELALEVGGAKLKCTVAHGDELQGALKIMPKHIREKREKEVRKRNKERNRPILVGAHRFINVSGLRGRVKEIINSRSDGEQLKPDGSDFKLIKALLSFHPKGEAKSKGMVGIKVAKSSQGESRCFWMVKEDGSAEDFSAQKCLGAVEANPPYVEADAKKGKDSDAAPGASLAAAEVGETAPAKSVEAPAAEEKKEVAAETKAEVKTEEKKEVLEEKKEEQKEVVEEKKEEQKEVVDEKKDEKEDHAEPATA